jgi:hypothetical protein
MLKRILSAVGVLVVGGGIAIAGLSAAGAVSNPFATSGGVHACILPDTYALKNNAIYPNDADHPSVCYNGAQLLKLPTQQAMDNAITVLNGKIGRNSSDIQDLQSTKADKPASVSAVTSVSNWPESSGWANDTFTRTASVTRVGSAPSSKCGGSAVCWEYTGLLVDNGTFLTTIGGKSPQAPVDIAQQVSGSMIGSAGVHFYASSNAPDSSLVAGSVSGRGDLSTTGWVAQFFHAGQTFDMNLTSYKWTYTAPATCEQWVDAINPGDDGASPADGDITGVVQSGCVGS